MSPEETVIFSNQFASVFSDELPLDLHALPQTFIHDTFLPIVITENGVARAIERLNTRLARGLMA